MTKIQVCMGSACHLKGAPLVAQAFQDELSKLGASADLELSGNFCQNQCLDGVVVKIDGEILTKVKPGDVPSIVKKCLNGVD